MFKRASDSKKSRLPKVYDQEKYYRMIADFDYLKRRNFKIVREIGRGGYGVVYQAEDLQLGLSYAIKIPFDTILRQLIAIQIRILLLAKNKPHIGCLRQIVQEKNIFHLVLDYYAFHPFITFFHEATITEVAHYLYQLLLGLKELKEIGIYHRDIKPANFLYNKETKKGKIIDFGLAEVDSKFIENLAQQTRKLEEEEDVRFLEKKELLKNYQRITDMLKTVGQRKLGTESFMPLESLLMLENQSYSSDIWPVGVIFLQCVTRRYQMFPPPNYPMYGPQTTRQKQLINFILQTGIILGKQKVISYLNQIDFICHLPQQLEEVDLKQICIIDNFNDVALDLLLSLLQLNPEKRISAEEALDHQFFDEIRVMHIEPYDQQN